MQKSTTPKYVTEATFKKESKKSHKEFKYMHERFRFMDDEFKFMHEQFRYMHQRFEKIDLRFDWMDAKVDRIAVMVVNHDAKIKEIKETMMTRDMGQEILRQFGDLARKYEEAERSARIHLNQLMDFRPQITDHEKRLVILETQASGKR